jgi:hypothetical protein
VKENLFPISERKEYSGFQERKINSGFQERKKERKKGNGFSTTP